MLKEYIESQKKLIKTIQDAGLSYHEAKELVLKGHIQIRIFDPNSESKLLSHLKEIGAHGHTVVNRDQRSNVYISTLIEINLF